MKVILSVLASVFVFNNVSVIDGIKETKNETSLEDVVTETNIETSESNTNDETDINHVKKGDEQSNEEETSLNNELEENNANGVNDATEPKYTVVYSDSVSLYEASAQGGMNKPSEGFKESLILRANIKVYDEDMIEHIVGDEVDVQLLGDIPNPVKIGRYATTLRISVKKNKEDHFDDGYIIEKPYYINIVDNVEITIDTKLDYEHGELTIIASYDGIANSYSVGANIGKEAVLSSTANYSWATQHSELREYPAYSWGNSEKKRTLQDGVFTVYKSSKPVPSDENIEQFSAQKADQSTKDVVQELRVKLKPEQLQGKMPIRISAQAQLGTEWNLLQVEDSNIMEKEIWITEKSTLPNTGGYTNELMSIGAFIFSASLVVVRKWKKKNI